MSSSSLVSTRLKDSMSPEVQEILYKPRLDNELDNNFEHINDVNQAHLLMLLSEELISSDIAKKLAEGLVELEKLGVDSIQREAAREDAHFNFEATLIDMVGREIGGRLHIGRSRNDMGATIDRMRARHLSLRILRQLNAVRTQVLKQVESTIDVIMPGYTHLQVAQPVTLGFYFLGIAEAFSRDFTRMHNCYLNTNHSPMGAAAFSGTRFPVNRPQVADLLGFDGLVEHSLDAVASRDFLCELGLACVTMGTNWTRLAQDLYIWNTDEFNLIDFPDNVSGTSSILPQKKNPVVLEYLKATGSQIIGDLVSMCATISATHFTNSIDGVRAAPKGVWQAIEVTFNSMILVELIVKSVRPNTERMLERVENSFATITDLAEVLVQEHGVNFRDAHHICGAVVRLAMDQKLYPKNITSEMIAQASKEVANMEIHIDDAQIPKIFDPIVSVSQRISRGGPSHSEVQRLLGLANEALGKDVAKVQQLERALNSSKLKLKSDIRSLVDG